MPDNPGSRDGRGAADPFDLIEQLTPSAAEAIEGMRSTYLRAFRATAGPGSTELGLLTWARWSASLREGNGIRRAARQAEDAALAGRKMHVRPLARLWVSGAQVQAAVRYASRIAGSSC